MTADSPQPTTFKRPDIVGFTQHGPTVRVVGFLVRELSDGSIWIENEIGEGMRFQPDVLLPVLQKFFNTHFLP